MSAVIHLPPDPARLRAGMAAVRARAASLQATSDDLRRALAALLRELQAGRSTAAAVARATRTFRHPARTAQGGAR